MFFFWPIHDEFGVKRVPFINYTIIFVNVIVYFLFGFSGNYEQIVETFGFIPARFSWLTIFTSMFLHGGIMHLVGNMWYLYLMGDNIEDRWGHFQYLVFYLFSGIVASLFYGFFSFGDARTIPSIGASGAISGVLGAYLVLFPKGKITFWYYIFAIFTVYRGTFDIFSYVWISLWFIQQLIGMIISIGSTSASGIAFGAHIGGFLAGMGIALIVKLIQRARYISSVNIGRNALYDIIGSPVTKPMSFEDQIELFNIEKQIKQLIKDGNFKDAAVLYGDAVRKFSDLDIKEPFQFRFAEILQEQGLSDEAIAAYKSFIRKNPFSRFADNALYNLGQLYLNKGEKEKAKNCFRQITVFYPYSELNNVARYALSDIKEKYPDF
jgi:membrane associated rhomboid family serine protease